MRCEGSIGGPILWLLFTCDQPDIIHSHKINREVLDRGCSLSIGTTNDIPEANHTSSTDKCGVMVGYVDDGAYSYASKDPTVLSRVLTEKYEKIEEWMNSNKLVINADKTHLMVMGSKRHRVIRDEVVISVGGYNVKPTETERLLGGYLHQVFMKWNLHIQSHRILLSVS